MTATLYLVRKRRNNYSNHQHLHSRHPQQHPHNSASMAMRFVEDALVQKHRLIYRDTTVHDPFGDVPTIHVVCSGRQWIVRAAQLTGKSQRLDNKINKAQASRTVPLSTEFALTLEQRQGVPVTFRGDICQSALDSFMCWIFDDFNGIENYDRRTTTRQKCRTCDKHAAAAFDHRENFRFGYLSRCYRFCELAEQKFIYAIRFLTAPNLRKLRRELERHERTGERRLRNALRRFLGKNELPDIPFPADDDQDDDDDEDNDDDEGFGGDDDLPSPGNGGPGAGPDDDGSDNDDEDDDGGDSDNNTGGRAAAPRRASHQSRHSNDDEEEGMFVGTPALPIADSIEDELPRSPRRRSAEAGNTRAPRYSATSNRGESLTGRSSRNRASPFARRQGPLIFDNEDEFDLLGSDLPGSLAYGSRRGFAHAETPRRRAAGARQATESPEIKQETPRPRKRKESGEPDIVIDLTGTEPVTVKIEPGHPRDKRPCRPQDIQAVLDLTGDDEEVQDITAQYISEAQHRLRCPRCETYFQAKLPRTVKYRHACPPGPVVAEHSNEHSFEAWTQRYQDRRSEPI